MNSRHHRENIAFLNDAEHVKSKSVLHKTQWGSNSLQFTGDRQQHIFIILVYLISSSNEISDQEEAFLPWKSAFVILTFHMISQLENAQVSNILIQNEI